MLDITALQAQWKAVRTDYDAIDEQWRKKKGAGESRGTCAAPPRDRSRQTQRYGRRCHGRSRRANRNVVPRYEPSQYEKQITDSQGIIADKYQWIGKLQQEIKRCTPDMRKRSPTLNRRHNSYWKHPSASITCSRTKGTVEMGKLLQDHRAEREQVHSKRNRRPVVRTATKGIWPENRNRHRTKGGKAGNGDFTTKRVGTKRLSRFHFSLKQMAPNWNNIVQNQYWFSEFFYRNLLSQQLEKKEDGNCIFRICFLHLHWHIGTTESVSLFLTGRT